MNDEKNLKITVAGPRGAGKSAVYRCLAENGFAVSDEDEDDANGTATFSARFVFDGKSRAAETKRLLAELLDLGWR